MFVVAVNKTTEEKFTDGVSIDTVGKGVMLGENPMQSDRFITVEQGLHTTEISEQFTLDPDLRETRYIIELDNRLGSISQPDGTIRQPSFVDDDNVATYNFQLGVDTQMIQSLTNTAKSDSVLNGPRGTRLKFKVRSSLELNSSTFLFGKLGKSPTAANWTSLSGKIFYEIDSTVRVTGATTGYKIDIPIRFVRYKSG